MEIHDIKATRFLNVEFENYKVTAIFGKPTLGYKANANLS